MGAHPSASRQGEYVALAALPGRTYTYTAEEAERLAFSLLEAAKRARVYALHATYRRTQEHLQHAQEEAARALAAWEEAGRPVPVAGEE